MTHLKNLEDLFIHELRDLYNAEQQLITALPKMANAATSDDLKSAFNAHEDQTRIHATRLENIFSQLETKKSGKECKAMRGLIQEGQEIMNIGGETAVKDAALIAAAQRIEHYEMAGYGTVRTYAKELGYNDAANLLQQTLNEEGNANQKLTNLAQGGLLETGINEKATV